MRHEIDLTKSAPKRIAPLPGFSGVRPDGETLSFTNYYMELGGAPFFGVSGEIHYARLWEQRWEDAILKMKAGGVNIVSTYAFWIHHEEVEGAFDFSGRRNLRRFVELCGKHGLHVIARIGPFCHGEARNGGLPDWLYGKPFEVRSLDEGFLAAVQSWYRAVAGQLEGLFFKDGGPVIAVQLDNEYMHSAAPWEETRGLTDEWLPAGDLGDEYLLKLLEIARSEGLDAPFYTATGWGGAATPDAMMPFWGGYAFRPWLFYERGGEHPATGEYLYRDNHNDAVPKTYNFEPAYPPESRPYLCCEMGGGMFVGYNYRFQLPYESVDAMAGIKLGSGCNMLGYYMYHGGTNPVGRSGGSMNEGQVPRRSYDYQAALSEFGQARPSYRRLRALHLLTESFERELCPMKTFLPEGSQHIEPADAKTLRWAVRASADGAGFLFINNYQDHAETLPKAGEDVAIRLPGGEIVFEGLSLAAGENCALPFNWNVGGLKLRLAHAQPLRVIKAEGDTYAFFFAPEGMKPLYAFPAGTVLAPESDGVTVEGGLPEPGMPGGSGANGLGVGDGGGSEGSDPVARIDAGALASGGMPRFAASQNGATVHFVTLSRAQSLDFSVLNHEGREVALMTEGITMPSENGLKIEHDQPSLRFSLFPDGVLPLRSAGHSPTAAPDAARQTEGAPGGGPDCPPESDGLVPDRVLNGGSDCPPEPSLAPGGSPHGFARDGLFARYRLEKEPLTLEAEVRKVGPTRYALSVPGWDAEKAKDVLLSLQYRGDIGQAFINGALIADNFWNGADWVIGLAEFREALRREALTVVITPVRRGARVNVESAMAGRREEAGESVGSLDRVSLRPVYEWRLY